ncbi:MAG: extracellular solute-binding protein [Caldilineales bacterium]
MFRQRMSLVLALLVVASMLLAACGGAAQPTAAPVVEPTAAPVEPTAAPVEPTATPEPVATEVVTPTAAIDTTMTVTETLKACDEGAATLSVWADDQRSAVLADIKQQVIDETGVCLSIEEVGFGDIRSKVSLAAPAGEGPDIFVGAHDWLGELVANGVPAEMDLGDKAADFDPVSLEAFSYEGKLLGLPYAVENVAFVCNTDLVPTAPATYEELMTMAKEMQDAGTVKQFFALMAGDPYHQEPINTAFGGYIFKLTDTGYDACDVGLDSEGSVAYLDFIDTMVKDGMLSADVDWETAHVLFETGDAACMITGPWALDRFKTNNINYSINKLPGEGSPFVGVQGFMINAFSDDKVLAQTFLTDYIATNEVMEALYKAGGRPPAYVPAQAAMDDDAKAFAAVATTGHPMPAIPAMSAVWGSWGDAIVTVFQQSAAPADAAATAAGQVREAAACE